jgi:hypothetical protein
VDELPGFTLTPDLGSGVGSAAAASLDAIDHAYLMVQDLLNAGFPYLEGVVWALFGMAAGWAVLVGVIDVASGGSNPVALVTGAFLRLGIFVWLAGVWKTFIDAVGNFALDLGVRISGSTVPRDQLMVPSRLFAQGNEQAAKVMAAKDALCDAWKSCLMTFGDQLLLEIIAIAIWVMFGVLVLAMVMAALWLKKAGLFSFLFLPASQVKATAFLAEGSIAGVFQAFMWLVFITLVAGWGTQVLGLLALPEHPDAASLVPAVLVVSFMAVMAWQSRSYASGLVSGVPRIGGEAVTAAARNALGWATGGTAIASRMESVAHRERNSVLGAARDGFSAARSLPGRAMQATRGRAAGAAPGGARAGTAAARTTSPGGGGGSAWNNGPTPKQQLAARHRGVDISGMSRGQASQALHRQGNMDQSWYEGK